MNWYIAVLKKFSDFKGRSRRQEFWTFFLINFLIGIGLGIVDSMLGTQVLGALYGLVMLIPGLAVGARRLHDIGRTGWWQLIALIPIIGVIVLIVFYVQDSDPGDNRFGANPKATAA